ncbi:hypothetical protein GQ57_20630 [Burkholderia sp. MSh2]|uniref:ABC transporter membrane protein n=1 Tax=Burkholderia paludis TaxID=1506587 RepID=A0A6J5DJ79_9BURK|nr:MULTISPECIES: ABC transporter permease [Burkholderia]KEZ04091.1 hypothetical protein GQ57_20630 [Burkholderia sp. MSh2]CAB3753095.1 Spermidine/putrescine transport system permease protein PotB [Burkholderia paludis]VWB65373.1 ABC transporter membrane protein [Burkholderia paludis]
MSMHTTVCTERARYPLLLPVMLVLLAGFAIPMLIVAVVSVSKPLDYGGVAWGTFSPLSYVRVLFDQDFDGTWNWTSAYATLFCRTVLFALLTTILCAIAGFPVALFIAMQPKARRPLLLMLVSIPFWTNMIVRCYSWIILLRDDGVIGNFMSRLHLGSTAPGILYSNTATFIGLTYAFLPFMVLPIYTSLEKMNWELAEAAYDLGANRIKMLRRVVIPISRPGIVSGCMLVFVPALGAYLVPDLLGGGKSMMLGNLIQMQFGVARNWSFGAALSLLLFVPILASVIVLLFKENRKQESK